MMEIYKIRAVDFQYKDERGSLTQLVHEGFSQINILESKKGSVRGSHFHKESIEAFYLIKGSVRVELISKDKRESILFKQGDFFEIPINVLHNMSFPEYCLMLQMYDKPVEKTNGIKDIYMENEFNV